MSWHVLIKLSLKLRKLLTLISVGFLEVHFAGSGLLQIGQKLEKGNWRDNLRTWHVTVKFIWRFYVFLVKSSYWSKFHVNIITGSGVMIIFIYKGFTRNPDIGNTRVWVLPNIRRLGQFRDTKFGTNVSNKKKKLLNAANCYGYSFYWL